MADQNTDLQFSIKVRDEATAQFKALQGSLNELAASAAKVSTEASKTGAEVGKLDAFVQKRLGNNKLAAAADQLKEAHAARP